MKQFDFLRRLFCKPSGAVNLAEVRAALAAGKCVTLEEGMQVVSPPRYPEAERIADSLRDFPGDWVWAHKGYTLKHVPSGFVLWVANQDRWLAEDHGGGYRTVFGKPEQGIIWPAVEAWLERFKVGFTGRLPKVRIHGARGTFWCVADGHPWAGAGNSPADAYRAWSRAVSIQARKDINLKEYLHVWSAAL